MRISDWSSDVCSSDLDRQCAGSGDPRRVEVGDEARLERREVQAPADAAAVAVLRPSRHRRRGRRAVHRLPGAAARRHAARAAVGRTVLAMAAAAQSGDAGESLRQAAVHGWSDVGRSEDHTSELQSLMRISYAVFCLKKKKTNTYT